MQYFFCGGITKGQVYSVDWNLVSKDTFVSGSWDNTVKLWSPERPRSIATWAEHGYCVYSTVSPKFLPSNLPKLSRNRYSIIHY